MKPPTRTPPKVFLDSSAFFAAAYSAKGSAHDLLIAAAQDRIRLVISQYVLQETERNLLPSAPQCLPNFLRFRENVPYQLSEPSRLLIINSARIVVTKDAPIIAAARAAQAPLVATYDRKDSLAKWQEILAAFNIIVATPQEILASLESEETP